MVTLFDGGVPVGQVAGQLLVSVSYVSKVLSRRRLTGEVSTRPQRCQVSLKLASLHELIAAQVAAKPDATIGELHCWLTAMHGTTASQGLMAKTLARLNLTHKKRTIYAAEQTRPDVAAARMAWRNTLSKLNAGKLIFLDETWTSTAMTRLCGRIARGQRLVDRVPHGHWKISTFVAGLRQDGLVAPCVIDGAINGDIFLAYVDQVLVPALRPGETVIMDNLSSRKSAGVQRAIEAAG